jgi:hypothetical protein
MGSGCGTGFETSLSANYQFDIRAAPGTWTRRRIAKAAFGDTAKPHCASDFARGGIVNLHASRDSDQLQS